MFKNSMPTTLRDHLEDSVTWLSVSPLETSSRDETAFIFYHLDIIYICSYLEVMKWTTKSPMTWSKLLLTLFP